MTGDVRVTAPGLADAAIAAELERRRQRVAAVPARAAATTALLCWRIGAMPFAAPLAAIRHVSAPLRTTPLPGAGAAVIGLFARQGIIHTLFDPAAALGATPDGGPGTILIVRRARPCVAIRVDAVEGLIALPDAVLATAAQGAGPAVASPVARDGLPPVGIVDMARLIGHLTGGVAAAAPVTQEG